MASVTLADVSVVSDSDQFHCSSGALTGSLGLLVQALLAIVAFGALVSKFTFTVAIFVDCNFCSFYLQIVDFSLEMMFMSSF